MKRKNNKGRGRKPDTIEMAANAGGATTESAALKSNKKIIKGGGIMLLWVYFHRILPD